MLGQDVVRLAGLRGDTVVALPRTAVDICDAGAVDRVGRECSRRRHPVEYAPLLSQERPTVYSILVSILIGVAVGAAYTLLGFWKTWAMGIILGFLVAILSLVIISRILARRIEPRFLHAQKQIQSGANPLAIKTLEELLDFALWLSHHCS